MKKTSLFGKRIHITGSISKHVEVAKNSNVKKARKFVKKLVIECIKQGANFVVPVDREPLRKSDNLPICFDWLVWETIFKNKHMRPAGVPGKFVIGVQHYKNPQQIPECKKELWENILKLKKLFCVYDVGSWNMNTKRMEKQAQLGDALITLGGEDGVLFLANLYLNRGKPVIPIDYPICGENVGTNRIVQHGLAQEIIHPLFKVKSGKSVNSILADFKYTLNQSSDEQIVSVIKLLQNLENPTAFAVRLLDPSSQKYYKSVEKYFDEVVKPVVEKKMNFKLVELNNRYKHSEPQITTEIFRSIHKSGLVIADLTGQRPNCFLELGYALRNHTPIMITMKKGSGQLPFDITTYPSHFWNSEKSTKTQKNKLFRYFNSIRNLNPLVSDRVIIP